MCQSAEVVDLSDDVLVNAARAGDDTAMEMLIRRYGNLVRAKCRIYFLFGGDAEDVFQEGMIGLLKAVRDYDSARGIQFVHFATMCITRQIITAVKTATRLKHLPLNSYVSINKPISDDGARTLQDYLTSPAPGPEELAIRQELASAFKVLLPSLLTEYECRVLDLYVQGLSFAEMATRLGRGEKSVDCAVWRVKRKLRATPLAQEA